MPIAGLRRTLRKVGIQEKKTKEGRKEAGRGGGREKRREEEEGGREGCGKEREGRRREGGVSDEGKTAHQHCLLLRSW